MRNFILTAILFLTASIASAGVVYYSDGSFAFEGDIGTLTVRQANIVEKAMYAPDESYPYLYKIFLDPAPSYWKASTGEYKANIRINVKGEEPGEGQKGLKYYLYNTDGSWKEELEAGAYPDGKWQTVALPVIEDKNLAGKLAIRVVDKDGNDLTYQSYLNGYQTDFTFFGQSTVYFSAADTGTTKKAEFTFGSPLPTPVVTLLIALAFGGAFVMYRNRKQARA